MSGPLRQRPRTKATFDRLPDILHRQGLAIQELARSATKDFETFGIEQQHVKALLADALVSIEALKIQVAGLLAMQGPKADV